MKRARLTAVVAATAALAMFGLTAPATAEPTPTPTPTQTSVEPTPAQTSAAPAETSEPAAPASTEQAVEPTRPAPVEQTSTASTPDVTQAANPTSISAFAAANPWIGSPTAPETDAYQGGRMRKFTNATVYWSAASGAQAVWGGIAAKFHAYNQPLETFGYPVSGELVHAPGAVYQVFTKDTLYWTAQYGTHAISKDLQAAWERTGGAGRIGFPATDAETNGNRTMQQFQWGGITNINGVVSITQDGIGTRWVAQGGLNGPLRWVTGNETAVPGGVKQAFAGGTFYYSTASGAHSVHGGIGYVFDRQGGISGNLGFPASSEVQTANSGVVQHFTGGAIYWSPSYGAHPVSGAIGAQYRANGAEWGRYGLPVTDEVAVTGGVYQDFQGGRIYWSPTGSLFGVQGSIGAYWQANGGPTGRFGQPTSAEICNNAGCYQNFQGGAITWGPMTGAHDLYKLDARCTYGRVVCADKTTNKMYWVINGVIQGTFDARFGAPGWETTNGEMTIFRKEAMSWSVPFSAWMPWSQYFTATGMAIHYSSSFEADGFPSWGSHGCINMNNYAEAQWLFNQTKFGDRIVVYYS